MWLGHVCIQISHHACSSLERREKIKEIEPESYRSQLHQKGFLIISIAEDFIKIQIPDLFTFGLFFVGGIRVAHNFYVCILYRPKRLFSAL